MQSVTSYSEHSEGAAAVVAAPRVNGWFNTALLRKNLSRFWPIFALYTLVWLLLFPVMQALTVFSRNNWYADQQQLADNIASVTVQMGGFGGVIVGVIAGVIFAMALFSYLTTPRSVSMFHGFPIRREGLFLTNYVTGLLVAVLAPALAIGLTALVQLGSNTFNGYALGMGFLFAALPMVFFFSFAVLCAVFTGQILAIPVFYGVFNVLAIAICALVQSFASSFYYGYMGDTPNWVQWLTPTYYMVDHFNVNYSENRGMEVMGLPILLAYTVAGLVLAGLALAVYRRRKSETAGDVVAIGWARPLFRYGVAICAALSLGQAAYHLLWAEFFSNGAIHMPVMLVCIVLLGVLGYYVAEMLLQKSFKVLRKGLRGALGLTAGLVVFGVMVNADLLGVENRIPAVDEVESVFLRGGGTGNLNAQMTTPEGIALVQSIHAAILEEKDYFNMRGDTMALQSEDSLIDYSYFVLEYTLRNGEHLSRAYDLRYTTEDLQENSALQTMTEVLSHPLIQHASNDIRELDRFTGGDLGMIELTSDSSVYRNTYQSLTAEEALALYNALQRDIDAGHVGKNILDSETWSEETYANEVQLYYQMMDYDLEDRDDRTSSTSFRFSVHCTEVLAELEKLGLVTEERPLMTQAQVMALDRAASGSDEMYAEEYADYAADRAYSQVIVTKETTEVVG